VSRRLARAGLAALAAAACSGAGLPDAELPETPIAVVYRTPEDSRRRAEALADQEPAGQPGGPAPASASPEGVARVQDVADYMKSVVSAQATAEAVAREFPGRLALLDPRSRKVETLAAAWGQAVPQAWSADRGRLLFSALVDEFAQLFELEVTQGEVRRITRGPEVHPAGCHGPDGSYLLMTVAIVNDEPQSRLELLEPGNPSPRPITPGPRDHSPTCSPDGGVVVYVTEPDRKTKWVMARDLRGGGEQEPRRLGPGSQPRFCGQGGWIVYSAPIRRGTRIWRVRPDGSGRSPIGHGVLDETAPTCSPDGQLVVYNVDEGHRESLYVRRFDGTGDRILYSDSSVTHPVW
jgi:Tol biopolymer transport system component